MFPTIIEKAIKKVVMVKLFVKMSEWSVCLSHVKFITDSYNISIYKNTTAPTYVSSWEVQKRDVHVTIQLYQGQPEQAPGSL